MQIKNKVRIAHCIYLHFMSFIYNIPTGLFWLGVPVPVCPTWFIPVWGYCHWGQSGNNFWLICYKDTLSSWQPYNTSRWCVWTYATLSFKVIDICNHQYDSNAFTRLLWLTSAHAFWITEIVIYIYMCCRYWVATAYCWSNGTDTSDYPTRSILMNHASKELEFILTQTGVFCVRYWFC